MAGCSSSMIAVSEELCTSPKRDSRKAHASWNVTSAYGRPRNRSGLSSLTFGAMFVPCRIGPQKTPTEIEATAEREIYATFPLSAFMPRNATCFPAMIRERVGCAVYSSTPVHHGLRRNRSTRNGIQRSRVLTSEVLVPRQGEPTVIRAGVAVGSLMRPIRRRIPSPSHPREPQVRRPKGQHPGQRSGRLEQST